MIQINLLPPEYRPRTGTPVARFAVIVAGVILVASAGGAYAYTHFIELARVNELKASRTEEVRSKEVQRDRSLGLQAEIDTYQRRREAIQAINRSRTLWSRKLDQFFDIVTNQGTEGQYTVWLEGLEVPPQVASARRPAVRGRNQAADGGRFRFAGFLAMDADAPALSSAFYNALTGDPEATQRPTDFYADFLRINNPGVEIVNQRSTDEVLVPPVVAAFKYDLTLKPPEQPAAGTPRPPARSARGR
jgi:cell division protein FtsB